MKVTFVCPGDELLGIQYMSSVLKKNRIDTALVFDPRLLQDSVLQRTFLAKAFNTDRNSVVKKIIDTTPDLVAITSNTNNILWGFNIANKIKEIKNNVFIIFGGPHATAVPERIISKEFVDFVCVGSGEYALLDLCQSIQSGEKNFNIPGIWYKKGRRIMRSDKIYGIDDLDEIPFPDKELFFLPFPFLKHPYTITTSRGCPFSCTYCMESVYHKLYRSCRVRPYQRRSVKNVIDELIIAKKKWNIRSVKFYDELFAINKKWLGDFCHVYKEKIGLPFRCSVHPAVLDNEIVELLKYAGVNTITMGVESINGDILKNILQRNCSFNQIKSSMELLKKSKIYFSVDHIFGLPGESEEDHRKAALLYSEMRPNNILVYWLVYYPKTAIINYALKRKLIEQKDIELIEEGLGEISYKNRSKESSKIAYPFFLMFNLIPIRIIPKFIFQFIIKRNLSRFFKVPFFIIVLKQIFDSLDTRSSRNEQLKKTLSFIRYGLAFSRKPVAKSQLRGYDI
ncbi:MAG: B12-binding domain-containing radical SAM protein [Candidatus Hodarchaeota archaeon]